MLTVGRIIEALKDGARDVSDYVEDMASVPSTAGLDSVLGHLLKSDQPLAVTGDHDEFVGMLSRSKVLSLVSNETPELVPENAASPAIAAEGEAQKAAAEQAAAEQAVAEQAVAGQAAAEKAAADQAAPGQPAAQAAAEPKDTSSGSSS